MSERPTVKPEDYPKPLSSSEKNGMHVAWEFVGLGAVTALENWRATMVNPIFAGISRGLGRVNDTPALSPDSPWFSILQNSGDFYDGFGIGMASYGAASLFDIMQYRITKKRIPLRAKQAFSFTAATAAVTWFELGGLGEARFTYFPDMSDIPAGILGGAAYLGINAYVRRCIDNFDRKITKNVKTWYQRRGLQLPDQLK